MFEKDYVSAVVNKPAFKVYLPDEILIFQLNQTSLPRHIIIDHIIGGVKHNDQ